MTRDELIHELLAERFGLPTPPPRQLPHLDSDAVRTTEDTKTKEDVA